MSFTTEEIDYMRTQPVGRIATVSANGQPDAVPIGIEYDGAYFYVGGGLDPAKTRKFLNVADGNDKVVLLWDDLVAVDPWTPRFLRVYGTAEFVDRQGIFGQGRYLRITPTVSWSWNLEARPFDGSDDREFTPRRTTHRAESQADLAGSMRVVPDHPSLRE